MNKHIKINAGSQLEYLNIVLPEMLEYIKNGNGYNGFSGVSNHHTVTFTLNNSVKLTARAWETKTMIVVEWHNEESRDA